MVPVKATLVRVVVAVVQLPRRELASKYLTVGVRRRMILYYIDTILSVHPIEVIPEAASGAGRPRVTREGALELADVLGGSDLVYLGGLFFLAYQQPIPIDL